MICILKSAPRQRREKIDGRQKMQRVVEKNVFKFFRVSNASFTIFPAKMNWLIISDLYSEFCAFLSLAKDIPASYWKSIILIVEVWTPASMVEVFRVFSDPSVATAHAFLSLSGKTKSVFNSYSDDQPNCMTLVFISGAKVLPAGFMDLWPTEVNPAARSDRYLRSTGPFDPNCVLNIRYWGNVFFNYLQNPLYPQLVIVDLSVSIFSKLIALSSLGKLVIKSSIL